MTLLEEKNTFTQEINFNETNSVSYNTKIKSYREEND